MPKNTRQTFVTGAYFTSLLDFTCTQTKKDKASVYQALHMPPEVANSLDSIELDQTVNAEYFYQLLAWGAEVTKDPCFGLHYGNQVTAKTFSVLAYLALSAENLRQAVGLLQEYEALASSIGKAELVSENNQYGLHWHSSEQLPSCHVIDAVLTGWIRFARILTGIPVTPLEVCVTHNNLEQYEVYQEIWQCPVQFNSDKNSIGVSEETLLLSIENSDITVNQLLQQKARLMLDRPSMDVEPLSLPSIVERVNKAIDELYLEQRITLSLIAKKLSLSERSLQRELKLLNTNFKSIWDEYRKQVALNKVLNNEICLTELSDELQFSEQSAWTRAFKRWTGLSPLQYRKREFHKLEESKQTAQNTTEKK